jgi:sugar diacid utilization regulator
MHNYSSDKLKLEENKFNYKLNKIEKYNILDTQDFVKKLESNTKYL